VADSSSVTLSNSTLSGNVALSKAGGIFAEDNATVSLSNTAFVGYFLFSGSSCDISTGLLVNINNHFDDDSCDGINSGDAALGQLMNNGGSALTHLPQAGSPLIDAGDNAAASALTSDQRGGVRIYNGTVDIGAVEIATGFVQFGTVNVNVAENAGTATLSIVRVGSNTGAVSVNVVSSDGSATASTDYTAVSQTFS